MPRTIAFLTPLYFAEESCIGGGERVPLNQAQGVFEASGGKYRVQMISFGDKAFRREMAPGVELRVLKAAGKPIKSLDVISWDLPEAIADADLVHIHQAYTRCTEFGLLVARQQRKPICVTDHGGFTSALGYEVGALELADRIIAYSDFGASLYRTGTPISVIKGGVDGRVFSSPATRPKRDRFLFVGRLLPHKGVDRLIEALPDGLPLTIFARAYHPAYHEKLRAMARGRPIDFVLDQGDDVMRDLYSRAWANVLPSVYRDCYGNVFQVPELMGLTLLESMACGSPALCSRVGGMPEFVRHGETGFIHDSIEELREQLTMLATDPGLADRMGKRAREVIDEEYDLRVVGGKLASLYDELIERRQGVAA